MLQYIFNISQFFCKRISNTEALKIRSFLINYFFISDGKTEDNQSSFSVLPTFLFHTVGPIMEIQNVPLRNVICGFLQCPVEIIEQVGFIPPENNRKPKVFWYFQSVLIMYQECWPEMGQVYFAYMEQQSQSMFLLTIYLQQVSSEAAICRRSSKQML